MKHNFETLRTAYVDTSLHLSLCGEKSDDSLDSDSDSDKKTNITNSEELFID